MDVESLVNQARVAAVASISSSESLNTILDGLDRVLSGKAICVLSPQSKESTFEMLFQCLDSTNDEDTILLAFKIIKKLVSSLPLSEFLQRFNARLLHGLASPLPIIKVNTINSIAAALTDESVEGLSSILQTIIRLIGDDDIAVALAASNFAVHLSQTQNGLNLLVSSDVKEIFNELKASGSVVCMRVYEMIVEIITKSKHALVVCHDNGLLSFIEEDLRQSDDILLKLNLVSLLAKFGSTSYLFEFLMERGVVERLCQELRNVDGYDFVQSEVCKTLSSLLKNQNVDLAVIDNKLQLIDCIVCCFSTSSKFAALDTIATLMSNRNFMTYLSYHPQIASISTELASSMSSSGNTENQEIAFTIAALAFAAQHHQQQQPEQKEDPYQHFFDLLVKSSSINIIAKMTSMLSLPFDGLRNSAFHFMQSLSLHQWGRKIVSHIGGVIEMLLDRSQCLQHQTAQLRFQIIKLLVKYNDSGIHQQHLIELQAFEREGMYFKRMEVGVAVMDQNM